MNKRDALFLKPSDLTNSNISISATGLYVTLAAYVQEHATHGRLEMNGKALTLRTLAGELDRPEVDIKDSFYELLTVGLITYDPDGTYVLPVICKRMRISHQRANVGALGGIHLKTKNQSNTLYRKGNYNAPSPIV